jgi:hypothetical protein
VGSNLLKQEPSSTKFYFTSSGMCIKDPPAITGRVALSQRWIAYLHYSIDLCNRIVDAVETARPVFVHNNCCPFPRYYRLWTMGMSMPCRLHRVNLRAGRLGLLDISGSISSRFLQRKECICHFSIMQGIISGGLEFGGCSCFVMRALMAG